MVKFKDCKTKKDKFKYILSCIITVLITVIIVFSVFFSTFYFIGGSCSNKASAAELGLNGITDYTVYSFDVPTMMFNLNSTNPDSTFVTTRVTDISVLFSTEHTNIRSRAPWYNDNRYFDFNISYDDLTQDYYFLLRSIDGASDPDGEYMYARPLTYDNNVSNLYQNYGTVRFWNITAIWNDPLNNDFTLRSDFNPRLYNVGVSFYNYDLFSHFNNRWVYPPDTNDSYNFTLFEYYHNMFTMVVYSYGFYSNDQFFGITFEFPFANIVGLTDHDGTIPFTLDSLDSRIDVTQFDVDDAIQIAEQQGYRNGLQVAQDSAYNNGYSVGYSAGDDVGYQRGLNTAFDEISPFQVLSSGITSIFNIELFPGFKLNVLLYISIGLILFGVIMKVLFHG